MKLNQYIEKHGIASAKEMGTHLFRQGDPDSSLYLVRSGLLKAYYLSSDGKENIKSFISPGGTIGSLSANHADGLCTFNLVCLKPSEVVCVNFQSLYEARQHDLELSTDIIDFLLGFARKKERREFELLCLSAEERYRQLLEKAPDLLELVTQDQIARYLGMTPVGLSRIKKRLSQNT